MSTTVQTVDSGQLWLPLDRLQRMARMEKEATWIVLAGDAPLPGRIAGWEFKDTDFLLSDLTEMVRTKRLGGSIAYMLLLFLAMLAILDTQVLSIFHRRKEIGTLMALGLTRGSVIRMFTMEGAFNAVLAALVGSGVRHSAAHLRRPPRVADARFHGRRRLFARRETVSRL